MYDTNEGILVARKSNYLNNNIVDEYFIVSKEEWFGENDGVNSFHLFLTKIERNRVSLFLTGGGNSVIFRELPLSRRSDCIKV